MDATEAGGRGANQDAKGQTRQAGERSNTALAYPKQMHRINSPSGERDKKNQIMQERNKFLPCVQQQRLPPYASHVSSVQLAVKRQHHIGQKRPSACSSRSSKNPNLILCLSNQARVRPGSRRDIAPMPY
jgi:hypothetical protein